MKFNLHRRPKSGDAITPRVYVDVTGDRPRIVTQREMAGMQNDEAASAVEFIGRALVVAGAAIVIASGIWMLV